MLPSFNGEKKLNIVKNRRIIYGYLRQMSTRTFWQWETTDEGKERWLLSSQEIQLNKPVGLNYALWSLLAPCCCLASAPLCTTQGTVFQTFAWAPAELVFHAAEGLSVGFSSLSTSQVPDGANSIFDGLTMSQIWCLAPRRGRTVMEAEGWYLSMS